MSAFGILTSRAITRRSKPDKDADDVINVQKETLVIGNIDIWKILAWLLEETVVKVSSMPGATDGLLQFG